MNVDKAWGHGQSIGINFSGTSSGQARTDFGNDPVADRYIGHTGRRTGAIDEGCIADH